MKINSVVFWDKDRECENCNSLSDLNCDGLCSCCALEQAEKRLEKLKKYIQETPHHDKETEGE